MEQLETGSFIAADAFSPAATIRIVSWNINRGLQLNGVIEFLRQSAPDVILLQETDVNARRTLYRNIARDVAQALRMHYVFGCEFQELSQGNHRAPAYHGQANLSRLPFLESRILRFRKQSDFWRPRWFVPNINNFQRRLGGRMALVSLISWFEKPLVVYNVHLESRGNDGLRSVQLTELLEDVRQYHAALPVVIAGDFNFDLSEKTATSLLTGTSRVGAPFENPFDNGNLRATTTPSRLGRARAIDWILSSGPLLSTKLSYTTLLALQTTTRSHLF